MNTDILREYRLFRGKGSLVGYDAAVALANSKTVLAFRSAEVAGIVRIIATPDEDNYFDVYGECDTKKEHAQIVREIDRVGCWMVSAQRRCSECGSWKTISSIGMCIYADPADPHQNGYVCDLMAAALED